MPTRFLPPLPPRRRPPITNKTRLKLVKKGNIDDEEPIILEEEDEQAKFQRHVAGVDQEESNEHHLQAVLSLQQSAGPSGSSRKAAPSAYIPTPDSTGLVGSYDELYPPRKWTDPHNYVMSSNTVEDECINGLVGGWSYYMDERDKEWLDKNNEEARGEGTCAQGAVTSPTTRMSPRASRAKGKEPESIQAVKISEDEFELVMGLFERVTHEQTEFLHHSLSTGMTFPAFSEYQNAFSNPLQPTIFVTMTVPKWIPQPPQLLTIAKLIYPHWKERRIERNGHRIIPTLNFDESDTPNESYVCFRRRDVKAVRKTRATQLTSGEKLLRLHGDLDDPFKLVQGVLSRELVKKDSIIIGWATLKRRMQFASLLKTHPLLGDTKENDVLLTMAEFKKAKRKAIPEEHMAPRLAPSRRRAALQAYFDNEMAIRKEKDRDFDNYQDFAYMPPTAPGSSRLFKYYTPPAELLAEAGDSQPPRAPKSLRLRYGRGGRLHLDRHVFDAPINKRRRLWIEPDDEESSMDVDTNVGATTEEQMEEKERNERMLSRWRFDADDEPAVGLLGSDEQDRVLVDEYDLKYLAQSMKWLNDVDMNQSLSTEPTLSYLKDGTKMTVLPYRLGHPTPLQMQQMGLIPAQAMIPRARPVAQPAAVRISSNGGLPSRTPSVASSVQNQVVNGVNGVTPVQVPVIAQPTAVPMAAAGQGADVTPAVIAAANAVPIPQGVTTSTSASSASPSRVPSQNSMRDETAPTQPENPTVAIARPKSQMGKPSVNGYPVPVGNPYPVLNPATAAPYLATLKPEQVQAIRGAFASVPDLNALRAAGYIVGPNANFNLQLNAAAVQAVNGMNLKIPPNGRAAGGPVPSGWPPAMQMASPQRPRTPGGSPNMKNTAAGSPILNGTRVVAMPNGATFNAATMMAVAAAQSPPHPTPTPSPMMVNTQNGF